MGTATVPAAPAPLPKLAVEFKPAIPIRSRYENWIGGQYAAPVRGNYFTNPTPITGQPLCEVARSTHEDVDSALDAAHAAAASWNATSPAHRALILNRIAVRRSSARRPPGARHGLARRPRAVDEPAAPRLRSRANSPLPQPAASRHRLDALARKAGIHRAGTLNRNGAVLQGAILPAEVQRGRIDWKTLPDVASVPSRHSISPTTIVG